MVNLLLNTETYSIKEFIISKIKDVDSLNCAVAYLTDSSIIDCCLEKNINVKLIVSLTPPTNPYVLQRILPFPNHKIEIKFFSSAFHSKLITFMRKNDPVYAIIGSSNFTIGGLQRNIESNVFIEDDTSLFDISNHFNDIWLKCSYLTPNDIENYIELYNKAIKNKNDIEKEITSFEQNVIKPRLNKKKSIIKNEGLLYYEFWKYVDDVKNIIIKNIKSIPDQPLYLVIDHFWHWIIVVWDKKESDRMVNNKKYQEEMLPLLFQRYLEYDMLNENVILNLRQKSNQFAKILSEKNIPDMTSEQAQLIYKLLYSTRRRVQQFKSDKKFVELNTIENIRESLKYLLWDKSDIAERISMLIDKKNIYKLKEFGANNIQRPYPRLVSHFQLRYP